jgi:hypothetical protein
MHTSIHSYKEQFSLGYSNIGLTPGSKVGLKSLIVNQLVNKLPTLCGSLPS